MLEEKELDDNLTEEKETEEVRHPKTPSYKLKAIDKYNKKMTKAYTFRLNKNTDKDLIEFIDGLPNKSKVFKEFFRDGIQKQKDYLDGLSKK